MNPLRQKVVEEARKWLGTPYHHAGRVRQAGVDCAMLLCEVYHAAGLIPYTAPADYPPDWHMHRNEELFLGWIKVYGTEIAKDAAEPGDVVLYKFGRCVSHGAIVVEWPAIIHAMMHDRRVIQTDGTHGDLEGRLHSAWTFEAFQ